MFDTKKIILKMLSIYSSLLNAARSELSVVLICNKQGEYLGNGLRQLRHDESLFTFEEAVRMQASSCRIFDGDFPQKLQDK